MELPNRQQLESDLADKLGTLSTRHRHELEDLLGYPPNIANVPDSFWAKVQREYETELVAALLLLFSLSADYHATLAGVDSAGVRRLVAGRADSWATQRGESVAASYVDSAKRFVAEKVTPKVVAPPVPAQPTLPREPPAPGVPTPPPPTTPVPPTVPPIDIRPLEPTPITVEDFNRVLLQTFGPDNDARRAVNEVTNAQSAGGEAGIELTVGVSIRDRWRTNPGRLPGALKLSKTGPCIICEPMDGVRRLGWIDPRGPGSWIHEGCVCDILYANLPNQESAAA